MTAKKATKTAAAAAAASVPNALAQMDSDGAAAFIGNILAAAMQASTGVASGVSGTAAQQAAAANATEQSHKNQTDVNSEEAISTYNQLAVKGAQTASDRVGLMGEQILQDAITAGKQITTNAITFSDKVHTDAATVTDFLHMQGVRHEALAADRIWNLDEQIAAAEALYAALGRYLAEAKSQQ